MRVLKQKLLDRLGHQLFLVVLSPHQVAVTRMSPAPVDAAWSSLQWLLLRLRLWYHLLLYQQDS